MGKIAIFFAEGYEEIEALAVVDICKRCNVAIDMVSVTENWQVEGSHGITVSMDKILSDLDFSEYDMLVLPGGLKGTQGLEACEPLMEQVDTFYQNGKYIAAICAAPSIFGHRGILKGRKACSHPNFESHLEGALVTKEGVAVSDHVITSRGMGTALDFGLTVASVFCGREAAADHAAKFVYSF